jgi:hypothetical protein
MSEVHELLHSRASPESQDKRLRIYSVKHVLAHKDTIQRTVPNSYVYAVIGDQ